MEGVEKERGVEQKQELTVEIFDQGREGTGILHINYFHRPQTNVFFPSSFYRQEGSPQQFKARLKMCIG